MTDSVADSMSRIGPGEKNDATLLQVVGQIVGLIPGWIDVLKDCGAPTVVIEKYELALTRLEDTRVAAKERARNAERTLREVITSAEWYFKGDKAELADAKVEALRPCNIAREIRQGKRVFI
jgi:hypothetical protein